MLLFFTAVFPLGLVHDIGLVVIPVNILGCTGFSLIFGTGRVFEVPFAPFWNSLPRSNMSVTIERNLAQRLDDSDPTPAVVVDDKGILW